MRDSLREGMAEKSPAENVILEINGSRHAYNVSIDTLIKTVTMVTSNYSQLSNYVLVWHGQCPIQDINYGVGCNKNTAIELQIKKF